MLTKKIYAKVLNCEGNYHYFEMLKEDIKETQSKNIFICYDEKNGINNDLINNLIENIYYFSDWALSGYYKNNLAALIIDYIKPYKKISLKSALKIAKAIKEETNKDDFILTCLNAIYNKRYEETKFYGYCQGDYAKVFYAIDEIDNYYLKYAEAVVMATGCEIMIHDEAEDPSNADEISGYCDYFIGYNLKEEIAERCNCDVANIVLYKIDDIQVIHKVIYKLAK